MKINIIYPILAIILIIFIVKKCEDEPKVVTKTKFDFEKITDSIKDVLISEIEPVYIDTGSTKYIKGDEVIKWKDSLVYVDKPSNTTIKANQFKTTLKSNNASADLTIISTGTVLDVQGVINYTQTNTTTEIKKIVPKSGLFLYGETSINPFFERAELGLDYQIKNTVIIGTSASYNNLSKSVNFNVKLGFRVF